MINTIATVLLIMFIHGTEEHPKEINAHTVIKMIPTSSATACVGLYHQIRKEFENTFKGKKLFATCLTLPNRSKLTMVNYKAPLGTLEYPLVRDVPRKRYNAPEEGLE